MGENNGQEETEYWILWIQMDDYGVMNGDKTSNISFLCFLNFENVILASDYC